MVEILNKKKYDYTRLGIECNKDETLCDIFIEIKGRLYGTKFNLEQVKDQLDKKESIEYLSNDLANAIIDLSNGISEKDRKDVFGA